MAFAYSSPQIQLTRLYNHLPPSDQPNQRIDCGKPSRGAFRAASVAAQGLRDVVWWQTDSKWLSSNSDEEELGSYQQHMTAIN